MIWAKFRRFALPKEEKQGTSTANVLYSTYIVTVGGGSNDRTKKSK